MDEVLEIALGPKPHKESGRGRKHTSKKAEKSEETIAKEPSEA